MPDMQTALKQALKQGNLRKPLGERIWKWLADHPKKTGKQLSLELGEKAPDVSSALSLLWKRDMVAWELDPRLGSRVWMAKRVYKPYELLPILPGRKAGAKTKSPETLPAEHCNAVKNEPRPAEDTYIEAKAPPTGIVVSQLPLAEAARLYQELSVYFGKPTL